MMTDDSGIKLDSHTEFTTHILLSLINSLSECNTKQYHTFYKHLLFNEKQAHHCIRTNYKHTAHFYV